MDLDVFYSTLRSETEGKNRLDHSQFFGLESFALSN